MNRIWDKDIQVKALFLVLTGLAVGLVMIRISPLTTLPGRDSGFFLYAGQQILKGRLPYIDFWDSKGPGIFFINALGLWIGGGTRWGVWLLEFIFLGLSAALFYWSISKKYGHGAALISSLGWLVGFSRVIDGGNLTEEYSLLFSFLLLALFCRSDGQQWRKLSIYLGACFALGFVFRANNTGVEVSVFLAVLLTLITSRQFRKIPGLFLWTGLAAAIVLVLVSIYFFRSGTFAEMFNAAILYNFYYSGSNRQFSLNLLDGLQAIGWPAYLAMAGYLALVVLSIRRNIPESLPKFLVLFALIDWPLEILLSSLSGKNYLHYFTSWLPVVAMLIAVAWALFSEQIFSTRLLTLLGNTRQVFLAAILAVSILYLTSRALFDYAQTFRRLIFEREKGIEMVDPVAGYIQQKTKKEDKVLIWGAYPVLSFLARRDAPTAYLFYPAYEKSPFLEKMSRAFYQDLLDNKPVIIVDASIMALDYVLSLNPETRSSQVKSDSSRIYRPPYQGDVFDLVKQDYTLVESIDGFDIYQLNSQGN